MATPDNLWFTYEPIPHTDKGIIYCEGNVQFSAKVTRTDYGKNFSIDYDGQRSDEIEAALKQMHDWFFFTHIKDAEDNEF